jgi:serine/threonine protein kinase
VCSALHYAHQMGIFHCDVKPANIFIERGGRVVLGDFGIARLSESATVTYSTPGTPAYMAPEQCRGEELDGRTDIYGLGVTTYEMLTLDRPFKGEKEGTTGSRGERVRWEQMNVPPPPPRKINSDISPVAETAILKALEKEPRQRQSGALAFYQELGEKGRVQPAAALPWVVESQPTIAPPVSTTELEEPHPVTQEKKGGIPLLVWGALGAVVFIVVAAILGIALASQSGDDGEMATLVVQLTADARTATAVAALQATDTRSPLLPTHGTTTVPPTESQPSSTLTSTPEPTKTPSPSPTNTRRPTATLTPFPAPTASPTADLSPQIVFYSKRKGNTDIYIMNADGSDVTQLTTSLGGDEFPVVSPDGRRIVFQSDRSGNWEIYTMNRDGSNETRLTFDSGQDRLPTWSPNGRQVLFSSDRDGDFELYVMDADGKNLQRLTDNTRRDGHASWSPDGWIVFNAGNATDSSTWEIYVMSVRGGKEQRLTSNAVNDWAPSWSSDGRQILFLSRRGSKNDPAIWAMDADGSNVRQIHNTPGAYDWGAVWSPDGRYVAFTSDATGQDEVYLLEVSSGNVTRLTYEGGMYPGWAP